jgi:hypothetical protein
MMLRFAVKEGKEPPATLRSDIAALDGLLCGQNLPAISELPKPFLDLVASAARAAAKSDAAAVAQGATPAAPVNPMELLLKVHADLAALIAPATPETLRATQPPPGKGWLGGIPGVVRLSMIAAVVCLIGFLITVPPSPKASDAAETKKEETAATPTPSATPQ